MKLNFGGNQGIRQRQASFELGPLYCSGKAKRDLQSSSYINSSPTSCRDLLLKGITQVLNFLLFSKDNSFTKSSISSSTLLYITKNIGWILYGKIKKRKVSQSHLL